MELRPQHGPQSAQGLWDFLQKVKRCNKNTMNENIKVGSTVNCIQKTVALGWKQAGNDSEIQTMNFTANVKSINGEILVVENESGSFAVNVKNVEVVA